MLIVMIGNIATGKTTYRKEKFINNEIIVCPDEWRELTKHEKDEKFIKELHTHISQGKTVVVDGNNISRENRRNYVTFKNIYKQELVAIDFGKGNDITLNRRLTEKDIDENPIWTRSHQGYLKRYEKPTLEEGFDRIIIAVNYE